MREMAPDEFVRRIKSLISEDDDSKFIFFVGAGCSVSSGIPAADKLVKSWLPRLKKITTGEENDWEMWAQKNYGYDDNKAASIYGKVIEELFLTPQERQKEIERLIEGKDPGFGYGVLAKLMTHPDCGKHFNIALTVNFDDLIADALYLYTNKKPLVIQHESLINFVRITTSQPLVIKLHGDARLEPKNTKMETEELAERVKEVIKNILSEFGLIFIGYGGQDNSIAELLNELPQDALPWGIYWVSDRIPDTPLGKWLKNRQNAIWVKHKDFDEFMLLFWNEFKLEHPDKSRFDKLLNTYYETFQKLREKIESRAEKEEPLEKSMEQALRKIKDWWSVELEARKYKNSEPDKADKIYQEGIKRFPNDAKLLGNYANFIYKILKDYDKAEEYYKRALEADPNHANNLGNYANFLYEIRKDYDKAEEYYKRALEADPNHANNLGNYANFLKNIRKDYDKAEEYYKRALETDPR